MAEWSGVVNATAKKYLQGAVDGTIRDRLLLTLLRNRGRITFNHNGYDCNWNVQFDEQPIEPYTDGGVIDFSRHDLYRQLNIDWRGYKGSDRMTEKERLMNRGNVAIINRYSRIIPTLIQSMTNKFAAEFYVDGYASGNEARLHGIESFMGTGTVVAADRVAQISETYGGRSLALQAEGGTWSSDLATPPNAAVATDWPEGKGDTRYDYIAPKILNYTSSNWGTGSTTWANNCARAIRQACHWTTRTGGKEGKPTLMLLGSDLFYQYQNYQEAKFRILVPHKEASDLGFTDTLNQDGVMITSDFDVPASVGYGVNVNQMELCSMDSKLFGQRGPDRDPHTDSYLFAVGFWGNIRWNPKYFSKLAALA